MDKIQKGKSYEQKAAAYLQEQGVSLITVNYRCRQGEIDIVGIHEGCLVFVEVKYRRDKKVECRRKQSESASRRKSAASPIIFVFPTGSMRSSRCGMM